MGVCTKEVRHPAESGFDLVQEVFQYTLQTLARGYRQQTMRVIVAVMIPRDGTRYQPSQVGPVFQEPGHAFAESGQLVDHVLFKNFYGEEGNQPNQRPQFERNRVSVYVNPVVVESIVFVPKAIPYTRIGWSAWNWRS